MIDVRPNHICLTKKPVSMCVIDENGVADFERFLKGGSSVLNLIQV